MAEYKPEMLTTPSLTDVTRPKSSQFTSFVLMLSFTNHIFIFNLVYNLFEEGQIRTDTKRFGDACSATKLLLHLYSSKHNTIAATNTKSKTKPVNNTGNAAS